MKMTLLEMVQDILNDLDSDEVNSIDDTIESQQVAQIVKTCFYEQITNRNWPHLRKLVQLEASGTTAKPNYLQIPEKLKELLFFKYQSSKLGETKIQMLDVAYKEPDAFLRMVQSRDSDLDNVDVITDFSGTSLLVVNDKAPEYWTSFDDEYIITDSYNSDVDDTLKKNKTQCLAYIEPTWVHTDDAIPDLPDEAFPGLLEEAKSTAFLVLKQMANQKAEQKASRQARWLARKAWATHGGIQYEDYGRKNRR
jgi:hypothetical protein